MNDYRLIFIIILKYYKIYVVSIIMYILYIIMLNFLFHLYKNINFDSYFISLKIYKYVKKINFFVHEQPVAHYFAAIPLGGDTSRK